MAALDRISIAAIGDTPGGSRRAGELRRGRRHRLRLDAGALPQLGDPGDLARRQDREGRRRDRHRLGVHPQRVHPRGHRARHRRDVGRPLPARARRRGEAAQRDLAFGRLRQARSAPPRDDRGDAPDHGEGLERRADPLRGRVHGHRHQGLGPPPQAGARQGADLRRRDAGGHVPDGRRRRRRADRPPDVPGALARRGRDPELRDGSPALGQAALRPRLHSHHHHRDRRRRGPRPRRRPPHDRLLLDRPHLQAALGDARLRGRRRGRRRRLPAGGPRRGAGADPGRDGRHLHRRRAARQGPRAGRRGRRARRRRLPHPGDLLHPAGADRRVPAEDRRGVRPGDRRPSRRGRRRTS